MSEIAADCPRCGIKRVTFDVKAGTPTGRSYSWKQHYEIFGVCRHCAKTTTFQVSIREVGYDDLITQAGGFAKVNGSLSHLLAIDGHVSLKDAASHQAPEYLPESIDLAFREGSVCFATGCYNASATMFRLCVDLATREKLPQDDVPGLNARIRRDLGLRLPWLFDNGYLPEDLRELSACIKEDGNDGAHAGTIGETEGLDLLDFTETLLERLYTGPRKVQIAQARREERRKPTS